LGVVKALQGAKTAQANQAYIMSTMNYLSIE
jgi:hypothetical protein